MALPELHTGDLVVAQIAGQQLIILVELLMSASKVFLPEGHSLASAPMLGPDISPNALKTIQLCGPAQVFEAGQEVDMSKFSGTRICIDVNDVTRHIARKP